MPDKPRFFSAKTRHPAERAQPTLVSPLVSTQLAPQSWQVVEIEGEATPVTPETPAEQPALPAPALAAPPARLDDRIVVGVDTHHLTIAVGETALFGINVLNNGDRRAHFELMVEGTIDPQWLVVTAGEQPPQQFAPQMTLAVGERATFWLALTPPRTSQSIAGDHPLRLSVRAAEYPGRVSQADACLTILPYVDFALGAAKPPRLASTWRQRTVRVTIPLINRSNQPTTFVLRSRTTDPHCRCELAAATLHKDASGQTQLTVAAGQRVLLTAQITLRASSWLRLDKRHDVVQIAATPLAQPESAQTTQVQIRTRAHVGPWQLAILLLLAGGGLGTALVFAVALLVMALRPAPPLASPPPASAPPIAIVVNLAQPAAVAPDPRAQTAPVPVAPVPNVVNLAAQQPDPDPALPIIDAAQVSTPGAAVAPAAFVPQRAASTDPGPTTYQQMFQEIALRYDLNWRVLAAQAYLESGFDSLALGNSGDLGLMQILPSTWREWAVVVNVTDPFDSYSNTLVAAVYLDYLRGQLGKKGYPQIEWMLVAYNWGIDKVLNHLAAGQGWDDLPAARRQYALDILRIAETIPVQ